MFLNAIVTENYTIEPYFFMSCVSFFQTGFIRTSHQFADNRPEISLVFGLTFIFIRTSRQKKRTGLPALITADICILRSAAVLSC